MPSAMQKRSYGSVTLYSSDEAQVWRALEHWVEDLGALPEVQAVLVFGSLAQGRLIADSDVDVLVVLAGSNLPFLERRARYAPAEFPVPIDVFAYTLTEIRRGQPLTEHALGTGRLVWCRPSFDLPGTLGGVVSSLAHGVASHLGAGVNIGAGEHALRIEHYRPQQDAPLRRASSASAVVTRSEAGHPRCRNAKARRRR